MERRTLCLLATLAPLWHGCVTPSAWADGGTVRLHDRQGPYEVTVFTAPTPLRSGPVDFSVLVQDAASGQPLPGARVAFELALRGRPGHTLHVNAVPEAATNKLLAAALFVLPEPGVWDVAIEVSGPGDRPAQHLGFALEAAAPLPAWRGEWPWLAWPAVAVGLFALHRWRVRRSIDSARVTCDNGPVPGGKDRTGGSRGSC